MTDVKRQTCISMAFQLYNYGGCGQSTGLFFLHCAAIMVNKLAFVFVVVPIGIATSILPPFFD
jgi:hypothetical protein